MLKKRTGGNAAVGSRSAIVCMTGNSTASMPLMLAAKLAQVNSIACVRESSYNEIVFFFQAEAGIRDPLVTGVQTCALPILRPPGQPHAGAGARVAVGQP